MKLLALSIPTFGDVRGPSGIPTGGYGSLGTIIQFLVSFAFFGAIIISLFFVVWAGIKLTMSQGDKQKIEQSKDIIKYAVIGITIIALSFLIVGIIGNFFGVPLV